MPGMGSNPLGSGMVRCLAREADCLVLERFRVRVQALDHLLRRSPRACRQELASVAGCPLRRRRRHRVRHRL